MVYRKSEKIVVKIPRHRGWARARAREREAHQKAGEGEKDRKGDESE